MARLNLPRSPLQTEALRLLQLHTGPDGRPDLLAVERDLVAWLTDDPMRLNVRKAAREAIRQLDEGLRPAPPSDQLTFSGFEPDALIPAGEEGARVWMRHARPADLRAWRALLDEENAAQNKAYAARIAYIDARVQARLSEDEELQAIEVRAFGWAPPTAKAMDHDG